MPSNFCDIINECALTKASISKKYGINTSTIWNWCKGVEPNQGKYKTIKGKIEEDMTNNKKIPFHPSYGYATEKEIETLARLQGAEKSSLLKKISKRKKNGGKT